MKVCYTIQEIRECLLSLRLKKHIGFVPTMGALHNGHISLIKSSKRDTEITVASIFVNPAQFNNLQDLKKYPRTIESDLQKLEANGCDFAFVPSTEEMYPSKPEIKIDLGPITRELEGAFRPGHFDGVGLVVSKLLHIIQPQTAFFGQKDIQQYFVVKKLIDELNFHVTLQMVSTEREPNGLAMSSRNTRLSDSQRDEASLLYKSLSIAKELILTKQDVAIAKNTVQELFQKSERLQLEYFEVVNTKNFKPLTNIEDLEKTAMCIAAEIGEVRLIDNLLLIS